MLEILLVDDDELVRQSLHLLLAHEGFRVEAAGGARQALELAASQAFDLVISDIRMPEVDGFSCVEKLRELLPDANFVLMTGYSEEDAVVRALREGVDDFFRKPFDLTVFLERIRQLRRQRNQRRTRGGEDTLESFLQALRRLPGLAERTDAIERTLVHAGRRLELPPDELRALATAVRMLDLVLPLAQLERPAEPPHNLLERITDLLAQAHKPDPQDVAGQLLAAAGARLQGRPADLAPGLAVELSDWDEGATEPAEEPPELRVQTFGETRIFRGDQEIAPARWESARARWLFLYLLSRRGQWHSQEKLRDVFWPESDADKAQRSLVSAVHRCRKALGDADVIQRSERGYRLKEDFVIAWDVEQLRRQLRLAQSQSAGEAIPALRQVEALYRGPFAPECGDEWAEVLRRENERLAVDALQRLARELLEIDPQAAEGRARAVLRIDGCEERAAATLLEALWQQSRRDEAVRFYRDFAARLERELQLPPGPELARTYLRLSQL